MPAHRNRKAIRARAVRLRSLRPLHFDRLEQRALLAAQSLPFATAINAAPSFTKGADQTVDEDAGTIVVAGWATNISAGPPEEANQRVAFSVTWDNSDLFSDVTIDPLGNLTFSLVPDAYGAAQLTVVLKDDGGTADGGIDQSAQTFRIQVNSVNDPPSFNMNDGDLVYPEDYGEVTLEQWTSFISRGPANEILQAVTFEVTTDNNDLFAAGPAIDASGKLTFRTAADANGSATITVVAKDSGGTANGGLDRSDPRTFSLSVSPVNDPPTFVKGDDVDVLEDAGQVIVSNWATDISPGPPDESSQLVYFLTSVSNSALFAELPAVGANGTLLFTPAADANGSSLVYVAAADDGDFSPTLGPVQTLMITVKAVNDPPSCTVKPVPAVSDESGPQSVPGWLSNCSAGPANESEQLISVVLSVDEPGMFAVGPSVDDLGTLSFTPAPNARGTAHVRVTVRDDGGMADGGSDASLPQDVPIQIDKPHLWRNLKNDLDVNDDQHVAPSDALAVINYINAFGALNAGKVPAPGIFLAGKAVDSGQPFGFLDVNGDNFIAPGDALEVIDAINAGQGGEGEGAAESQGTGDRGQEADALLALLAVDVAGQPVPRRRESVK